MKPDLFEYTVDDVDVFFEKVNMKEILEPTGGEAWLREFILKDHVKNVVDGYINKNEGVSELINLYMKKNNLSRKAILTVHGYSTEEGEWAFDGGNGNYYIQDWIDLMDGKYGALLIHSCNPGHHEIHSEKSAVIASNNVYSEVRAEGDVQAELFIPGRGYIETYTLDYELEKMRNEK